MSFHDNMSSSSTFSIDDDGNSNKIENKDLTSTDDMKDNPEKYTDLQEQVYRDKLNAIQKELQQLENGTHIDYVRKLKELELQQEEQLMRNKMMFSMMTNVIENEFIKYQNLAFKEYDGNVKNICNKLIKEVMEKQKKISQDTLAMELCLDESNQKLVIKRKLRRRPNDPVVQLPQKKRRMPLPVSNICYQLHEHEIENDIKLIREPMTSIVSTSTTVTTPVKIQETVISSSSVKKPGFLPTPSTPTGNMNTNMSKIFNIEGLSTISEPKIKDGKLLFEKRWYLRGQHVFVSGKQMAKFSAVISAIGNDTIWVKKTSDNSKFRIKLSYLLNGKMSIKHRAAF